MRHRISSSCEDIPIPRNPSEARLLLATARINCGILATQKNLADQLVQRDLLRLQYNRLKVKQARQSLTDAEYYVGRVRLMMRKNGYYAVCLTSDSPSGFHLGLDDDSESFMLHASISLFTRPITKVFETSSRTSCQW